MSASRYSQVAGFCENRQEYASPIYCGNFVEYFTDHQLLNGVLTSGVT